MVFQAMLVAVRIDVYGVIYAVVLGLMILVPRRVLAPFWVLFTFLHGTLLLLQYAALLGAPPSILCTKGMTSLYCSINRNKGATNIGTHGYFPQGEWDGSKKLPLLLCVM